MFSWVVSDAGCRKATFRPSCKGSCFIKNLFLFSSPDALLGCGEGDGPSELRSSLIVILLMGAGGGVPAAEEGDEPRPRLLRLSAADIK